MENEPTDAKLVTIAVVHLPTTATILKNRLEEEGIMVFLQNELMAQLYGDNTVGGIALQVLDTDEDKAFDLVEDKVLDLVEEIVLDLLNKDMDYMDLLEYKI
jgi:hypothetical protein